MRRDELRNASGVNSTTKGFVNGALKDIRKVIDKTLKKLDEEKERMSRYGKGAAEELGAIEATKNVLNFFIGEVNSKML